MVRLYQLLNIKSANLIFLRTPKKITVLCHRFDCKSFWPFMRLCIKTSQLNGRISRVSDLWSYLNTMISPFHHWWRTPFYFEIDFLTRNFIRSWLRVTVILTAWPFVVGVAQSMALYTTEVYYSNVYHLLCIPPLSARKCWLILFCINLSSRVLTYSLTRLCVKPQPNPILQCRIFYQKNEKLIVGLITISNQLFLRLLVSR